MHFRCVCCCFVCVFFVFLGGGGGGLSGPYISRLIRAFGDHMWRCMTRNLCFQVSMR